MWMVVVLVILLLVLGFGYGCCRFAFGVPHRPEPYDFPANPQYQAALPQIRQMMEAAAVLPYEDVWITTHDGLKLYGRYYHLRDGAPLQIQFHGYRGSALRDFCGGLLYARDAGFNVLLVDQRAHGRSQGKYLSFGVLERQDCLAWANYAAGRFGTETPILLAGISMGAGTVMMAAALPLPSNVQGIVADCGYTTPGAIIQKVMAELHIPAFLYPFLRLSGRVFGGFDLDSCSPIEAMARCTIPVLFIHGEADSLVPCQMSRDNYDACTAEKALFTCPDAGHGLCFVVDHQGYNRAARAFYNHALGTSFEAP